MKSTNHHSIPGSIIAPSQFRSVLAVLLIFLIVSLLSGCRKETSKYGTLTGFVREAGSEFPVINAEVMILSQESGKWSSYTVLARTKTNMDGWFSLPNDKEIEGQRLYIYAKSSSHYELEEGNDMLPLKIDLKTTQKDVTLTRRATIDIHVKNTFSQPAGCILTIIGRRQQNRDVRGSNIDQVVSLLAEAYVPYRITFNKIIKNVVTNSDTTVMIDPTNPQVLNFEF